MPSLTSQSRCDRCLHLTKTIAKLKEYISNLYKLFPDSLVTVGAAPIAAAEAELDSNILAAQSNMEDPWLQQGAKPKKKAKATSNPKIHSSIFNKSLGPSYIGIARGRYYPCFLLLPVSFSSPTGSTFWMNRTSPC